MLLLASVVVVAVLPNVPYRLNAQLGILFLVMFPKNCQNLFSFALLVLKMPTALSGGGRGGGLVKCSLTFKDEYLIQKRSLFRNKKKF